MPKQLDWIKRPTRSRSVPKDLAASDEVYVSFGVPFYANSGTVDQWDWAESGQHRITHYCRKVGPHAPST